MVLGVGVIGVSAERGWARESHVPAIQAVPGLQLAAVAGRDRAKAEAVAEAVGGGARAVVGLDALLDEPGVDVVAVTVPVPAHREVVLAALAAGKHVITEWPLTPEATQTSELAGVANSSGLHTAVGLQARHSPAVLRARELLASGVLGRVLGVDVLSTTAGFGPVVGPHDTYLEDPQVGMNLLTIQGAHTLDLVGHLVGRWVGLSAQLSTLHPAPQVGDTGGTVTRTLPDHILVQGEVSDSVGNLVPVGVQVCGGRPADRSPFRLELLAEHGTLTLSGGSARGFQAGELRLDLDGRPVDGTSPAWQARLAPSALNVAGLYAALLDDVTTGASTTPSFADASSLSQLVDAVRRAGADARRVQLPVT